MVRPARLTFGALDPLLLRAKLEVFNNQDQSRPQIVITDASSWYGHISAHVRTLVLLLGIPSLSVSCAPRPPSTLSSFLGPACWCADLLGLLPRDGQQAGGALGELAFPNDDQVPYRPCV